MQKKIEEEEAEGVTKFDDKQTLKTDDADEEDTELMSILQQESSIDQVTHNDDEQEMNAVQFDKEEESSHSEQNESMGKLHTNNCLSL